MATATLFKIKLALLSFLIKFLENGETFTIIKIAPHRSLPVVYLTQLDKKVFVIALSFLRKQHMIQ